MTVDSSAKSTSSNSPTEVGEGIKLKFIFANNDGVHVELDYAPSDSIESVSKSLIARWPDELKIPAPDPDRLRLICMGKGVLGPPESTLEECEIPVFQTHPTPVNVSIKPVLTNQSQTKSQAGERVSAANTNSPASTDCCCIVS